MHRLHQDEDRMHLAQATGFRCRQRPGTAYERGGQLKPYRLVRATGVI